MWWRIALLGAACVVVYFATVELIWLLLKKQIRKWADKELADLVSEVEEKEKKGEGEE